MWVGCWLIVGEFGRGGGGELRGVRVEVVVTSGRSDREELLGSWHHFFAPL